MALRGRANSRVREGRLRGERLEKLGLAKDRQDLCDGLAAWYGLRERDRWKVFELNCSISYKRWMALFPPWFYLLGK